MNNAGLFFIQVKKRIWVTKFFNLSKYDLSIAEIERKQNTGVLDRYGIYNIIYFINYAYLRS